MSVTSKRKRAFFFHYNKPATQRAGKPQITVHYAGVCHILDNICCSAKISGRIRKRQPRYVMAGLCESFKIRGRVAYVS